MLWPARTACETYRGEAAGFMGVRLEDLTSGALVGGITIDSGSHGGSRALDRVERLAAKFETYGFEDR